MTVLRGHSPPSPPSTGIPGLGDGQRAVSELSTQGHRQPGPVGVEEQEQEETRRWWTQA